MTDDNNDMPLAEDLTATLSFYLDKDEMIWVAAEWTETEEGIGAFAEFMFKLNSGLMLSDQLDFLRKECRDRGKLELYKNFIIRLNACYDEYEEQSKADLHGESEDLKPKKEKPVVRPTKVKPSFGY
jgi:hypothetical protein